MSVNSEKLFLSRLLLETLSNSLVTLYSLYFSVFSPSLLPLIYTSSQSALMNHAVTV